ncbi:unnamed protein product [Paramecium pentaurelia]|uniref:Transmembrane protein n=1 Tax=Paramecium pentaurelia TaxID=43138 RepID=A0A8S1SSN1_9CILI|nr:unnamed protein product [Paramecium pentaurelia]
MDQPQSQSNTMFMKRLSTIKCIAPILIALSIVSAIFAFLGYFKNNNFEFLILAIFDIILISILIITLQFVFTLQFDEFGNPQENNTSYIIQFGLQSITAIFLGIIITIIQYKTHLANLWFVGLQIFKLLFLIYLINKTKQFSKTQNGIHRFTLAFSVLLNILFLLFAATNFKFLVYLINNQVFSLDHNNTIVLFMQYGLFALLMATILISVILIFRVQNYFLIVAFLIVAALLIAATANGMMIRQYSILQSDISTQKGCRYALQSLGVQTVKQFLNCSEKYLNERQSPYLPCPQENQSYMWESNMDQIACINLDCCDSLKDFISKPLYHLTVWVNIIVAIGIIQAFNTAMLSKFDVGNKEQNVLTDLFMLLLFFGLFFGIIAIYNSISPQQLQLQDQVVSQPLILNQLTVLDAPTYKYFKPQKSFGTQMSNTDICELATNLMLTKVNLQPKDDMKKPGILLGILGMGGSFLINNDINLSDFKILTTDELITKAFPKANKPGQDVIIVEGSLASVSHFIGSCLQFCSDEPETADFTILQEFYEMENDKKNRILSIDPQLQQQFSKIVPYLQITANVQNSEDFSTISDADGKLYYGKFVYTTCQVMDQVESPFLSTISDINGQLNYFRVATKQVYTLLVKKQGYKNACALVDLTELSPKTNIFVRMVKEVKKHSMKITLEWTSKNLNLDLYGQFKGENFVCLTGSISKSCGGMSLQTQNERDQHIEILTIDQIQPFTYLIFIKRFMERTQALDDKVVNVQDWIESNPVITIYVYELDYPLVQYRLPSIPTSFRDKIDFTWLAFQFDGSIGDGPIELKTYWSEITNESIKNSKSYKNKFWPSPVTIENK